MRIASIGPITSQTVRDHDSTSILKRAATILTAWCRAIRELFASLNG
jgi:hypothetical protein